MPPGLAHALLALAVQLVVGGIAWGMGLGLPLAMVFGGVFAVGFYVGRERRQSEEWAGSNRIPPWRWKPRAARDIAWPLLAVVIAAAAVMIARPAWSHSGVFTPEENAWLNRQRAVDSTKCCDERDARVGENVEWRMVAGRYQVRISGEWRDVPPGRIMQHQPGDPSPWPGSALLFYSPAPNAPGGVMLWCFSPPPLT